MARVDVIMPQMGESIAEGTVSRWLKKVGDEVKRDEPIFEISTDKVDAEIPAPSAGVLAEILVTEGQTVPVQTVVARLETEKGAAVGDAGATAPAGGAKAAGDGNAVASAAPASAAAGGPPPKTESSRPAPSPSHPSAAPATARAPAPNSLEERLRSRSSPLVRKMAAEHGIELTSLQGTGIAGRVTKRDLLGYLEGGAAAGRSGQRGAPVQEFHGPAPEPWPGDVVEPMSVMRQRISEHMVVSRRTSAHVTSFMEIDFTRVARLRAQHRARFEAENGQKLTYMPFIIKAVTEGLKAYPVINASVARNSVIYRK